MKKGKIVQFLIFFFYFLIRLREADVLLIVMDASNVSANDVSIKRRIDKVIDEAFSVDDDDDDNEEITEMKNETKTDLRDDTDERPARPTTLAILNKIDLIEKDDQYWTEQGVIRTSCVNGDGLDELIEALSDVVVKM